MTPKTENLSHARTQAEVCRFTGHNGSRVTAADEPTTTRNDPQASLAARTLDHTNASGVALQLAVPDELLDAIAGRVAELLAPLIAAPAVSPWMAVGEAADYLRCKPKRVYDLISQRRIPVHRDGGRVLLRRDELDRYVLDAADTPLTPSANGLHTGGFSAPQRTVSPRSGGAR